MRKIIGLFCMTMILLTGCGSTNYGHSEFAAPFVKTKSSCWSGKARGKYTVSTKEYGILCSGKGYCEQGDAIAHPLEIESAGKEIIVTLSDDSIETETMVAGEAKLISCASGVFCGYLYVIVVNSSLRSKENTESPYINERSSCWYGSSRGKYTVFAKDYGVICSGNGYAEEKDAIAKPLEIKSSGYEIVIALADDSLETITMVEGDIKLISCESASFKGYLYVVVV